MSSGLVDTEKEENEKKTYDLNLLQIRPYRNPIISHK